MKLDNGDRNLIVSGLGRLLAEPTDPLTNPPEIAAQIRALRDRITFGDLNPAEDAAHRKTVAIEDGPSDIVALAGLGDEIESGSPEYALMSLRLRLESWLREQPDVADLDEVGDGIYGFRLANTNGVSLTVELTQ